MAVVKETSAQPGSMSSFFTGWSHWWGSLSTRDSALLSAATLAGGSMMWALWSRRAWLIDDVELGFPNDYHPYIGHLYWIVTMLKKGTFQSEIEAEFQRAQKLGISCFQTCSALRSRPNLYLCDPDLVRQVFSIRSDDFIKGGLISELLGELLGDGIFSVDPPESKLQRNMLQPMFSMRNLRNYMFECGHRTSSSTMKKLHSLLESDKDISVDMFEMIGRFTLSSFLEISFGKYINDIIDSYPETHLFSSSFHRLQRLSLISRVTDPLWKVKKYLKIGQNECLIANDVEILNKFAHEFIDLKSRNKNNNNSANVANIYDESGIEKFDMISLYLKSKPNASEKELRDMAISMILAGMDTTRVLLSWFLWCYDSGVMSEEHKSQLDDELSSVIQDGESAEDVTYTQLNEQLKFTEQCLLEVLRLYPPVKTLLRTPREDTEISVRQPDGSVKQVSLHHSITIVTSTWGCHRSPAFFDDPLSFKPERWTNGVNTFPDYRFLTFNLSPRLCLGRQFALMQAKIFLVHFLNHFRFELLSKEQPSVPAGPLLSMENGLPMQLKSVIFKKYTL